MKDKLERFSKGDFEYELPFICLSDDEVRIAVESGKKCEGSFTIHNSVGRDMEGKVYSSNRLMQIAEPDFSGVDQEIHYNFDASYLKDGEVLKGEFCIICDCGERHIPFSVQIQTPSYPTSLGKIKDLFQFTNLARMDWSEAKKVFRSEDFEQIFLKNEERYKLVYRNLIKSISTSQALEEFLIAIRKKVAIRLDIDKTKAEFLVNKENTVENIVDKLVLTKNNWGYAEIRVSTDAPFILLEQKFLWADRFIGNSHQVTYTIDVKKLKYGNNYGHIYIKTALQTIAFEVLCKCKKDKNRVSKHRVWQKVEIGLVDNYLSFRLNRINLTDYLEEAQELIKQLPGPEVNRMKELNKIHLSIISEKTKLAQELLEDLNSDEILLKKKNTLEYCCYLYLDALFKKDDVTIQNAANTIRRYYENGNNDWRILWLLLYIDKKYEKSKAIKLYDMKEQFDFGCRSPILYYEAVCVFNEEPFLLRELNEFEVQVLNFGIKNWILSKETAQQYIYLSNKKKSFDPVIFNGLCRLYDEYGTKEALTAICCMLIKGMKRAEKYFEWYRLGVDAQLRITELYEYYMYSISDKHDEPLAQPVLLYFIYNSSLNDKKKAYLYANIVRNKDRNEAIYRTYYKRMEIFAWKMLEGGYINHDLALLYREFIHKDMVSLDIAKHLPFVIYRNELVCKNPNIVNVIVVHKELAIEECVQLVEGTAQIDIYTSNAEILLMDSFGNRFVDTIEYMITPYINAEDYENHCIEHSSNPMLVLHLFDRYQSYRIMSDQSIEIRKKVLQINNITNDVFNSCCQTLVEFYYDKLDDEHLEEFLLRIDLHNLQSKERYKFIEIMLIRSFYDKAIEALRIYGLEGISINRLVKLCSGWMATPEADVRQDIMVDMCYYAFSHKKYDETILRYLVSYYNGTTREMYSLWKAARGFDLDTKALEERLLIQMLFSESNTSDSFQVFKEYYKEITSHLLVTAFLSYYAYKYLVHDYDIDPELYPIMKRELYYEENDICLLAWLKYNARNKDMIENELIFAEYNIRRMVRKGITLPFFLDYKGIVTLPDKLLDAYYVSYRSDPRRQIYLHYRLLKEGDQEFITERMPNVLLGIHVKEMMLFYHEALQYYITEETSEGTNVTESIQIQYECETPKEDDSKYNQINMMLMAREMQDDSTFHTSLENYVKKEYMVAACFKQIE